MCLLWRPSHSSFKMAPGIFDLSSTTDTSCVSITTTDFRSTTCSTFLHLLERKRKELRNQRKGEGMDILKKIVIRTLEKSTGQKQHQSLWLRFFLWAIGETVSLYQKAVLCQVCTHHPGGDRRHVAQHGIELLSLQIRDLPTGCRK